jgi:hypothetical protein
VSDASGAYRQFSRLGPFLNVSLRSGFYDIQI